MICWRRSFCIRRIMLCRGLLGSWIYKVQMGWTWKGNVVPAAELEEKGYWHSTVCTAFGGIPHCTIVWIPLLESERVSGFFSQSHTYFYFNFLLSYYEDGAQLQDMNGPRSCVAGGSMLGHHLMLSLSNEYLFWLFLRGLRLLRWLPMIANLSHTVTGAGNFGFPRHAQVDS
jgi:hypothetical protein